MFDITSSHSFLAKLEADFDDFMEEPHSAGLALNCAISAYNYTSGSGVIGFKRNTRFGSSSESATWLHSRSGLTRTSRATALTSASRCSLDFTWLHSGLGAAGQRNHTHASRWDDAK